MPEELWPEIAADEAQREEWVRLFAIDQIEGGSGGPGYSIPLTLEFLKANDKLVVDTRLFSPEFTHRLVASFDNLDSALDGVLVHGDNFQALRAMEARFRGQIRCVYIDPPYNTSSSAILYKNDYKHSSWATMMFDRMAAARPLLRQDGAIFVSIDRAERTVLEHALDEVFGSDNHIEELIWTQNTANSQLPNYSTNHEYVEVYARDRHTAERDPDMFREPKPGYAEVMDLIEGLRPSYLSLNVVESELKRLYDVHLASYRDEVEANGQPWDNDTKRQDPWRGIYPYNRAEYRDNNGGLVSEDEASAVQAHIWVWSEISAAAPASKQSPTTRDPHHPNYRFYAPLHPKTGKPSGIPRSGWKFPEHADPKNPDRRSFDELAADHRIAWGPTESKVPRTKGFLHEVETNIGTSVFYEYNDGEAELSSMFGQSGLFLSPKSSRFVRKFVAQATGKDDWFIDFFGGTGSSAHAVISQNRLDGGTRKYVLVEVGDHFDAVLKPRVLKAIYSRDWTDGKPVSREGLSQVLKVVRLESYEDTLNNLHVRRPSEIQAMFDSVSGAREDYLLHYMLDVETRDSPSLLDVRRLDRPFEYCLNVNHGGEITLSSVDLVETFNWLLGVRVETDIVDEPIRAVEGTDAQGQRLVVIWRTRSADQQRDDELLGQFFMRHGFSGRWADRTITRVYVNGDCALGRLRNDDEHWEVLTIEEALVPLMFAASADGAE